MATILQEWAEDRAAGMHGVHANESGKGIQNHDTGLKYSTAIHGRVIPVTRVDAGLGPFV